MSDAEAKQRMMANPSIERTCPGKPGHVLSSQTLGVMIQDRLACNESETRERRELVALCRAMLSGELSYFEGALRVCHLRLNIGVPEDDPDLMAFVGISSETDHLPPKRIQHRWSPEALRRLQPEFDKTEVWAKSFASKACENLITRFAEQ